ncbi:PIN domain-containing protein [Pelomicrobium methylotrophicum]|uniref:PIN domain-containing protein n=1 Tax=Pelomicrobium methylotrophicum TaxID=2602750 RepID=UPI001969FFFA|nr:PIN domain-containing protein [Pelomicrobium methylotrophicum]
MVTVAELRLGVARLPGGRRRKPLAEHLETKVLPALRGRVLAFDLPAAQAYAELMAKAQAAGKVIGQAFGLMAAIAKTHGMMVATRDTVPFTAEGVRVIHPWSEGG